MVHPDSAGQGIDPPREKESALGQGACAGVGVTGGHCYTDYRRFALLLSILNVNVAELSSQVVQAMYSRFQIDPADLARAVVYARSRSTKDLGLYLHKALSEGYYATGLKQKEVSQVNEAVEKYELLALLLEEHDDIEWALKVGKDRIVRVFKLTERTSLGEFVPKLRAEYTAKVQAVLKPLDEAGFLRINPFERRLLGLDGGGKHACA